MMPFTVLILFILCWVELTASDDSPYLDISVYPSHRSINGSTIIKRVEETLNITCKVISPNNEVLPKYELKWIVPRSTMHQNRDHQVNQVTIPGNNLINLEVTGMQETDSGDYTCVATREVEEEKLTYTLKVKVKNKKQIVTCSEHMFQCSAGNCINIRYMCDGKSDCREGEDEESRYCGVNACSQKLMCPDGRCIPFTWCCEPLNYTCHDHSLSCCQYHRTVPEMDPMFGTDNQRFSDMGFLQTTIYAVVGSAMAFMFVVTVLIAAICRIHLKRQSPPRCPNSTRVLTRPTHLQQLYDLDMCLNRPAALTDILVTYNINNGVQFVGRPVSPPPYCEVVSTPPREGPPPPYASQENLSAAEEREPLRSQENT